MGTAVTVASTREAAAESNVVDIRVEGRRVDDRKVGRVDPVHREAEFFEAFDDEIAPRLQRAFEASEIGVGKPQAESDRGLQSRRRGEGHELVGAG